MANFIPNEIKRIVPRDPPWITKPLKTMLKEMFIYINPNWTKYGVVKECSKNMASSEAKIYFPFFSQYIYEFAKKYSPPPPINEIILVCVSILGDACIWKVLLLVKSGYSLKNPLLLSRNLFLKFVSWIIWSMQWSSYLNPSKANLVTTFHRKFTVLSKNQRDKFITLPKPSISSGMFPKVCLFCSRETFLDGILRKRMLSSSEEREEC